MTYSSILNMAVSGILPSIIVTVIVYLIFWKKKKQHNIYVLVLILYLAMLFYVTIYRYGISVEELGLMRPTPNMIPFVLTYQLSIYSGWDIFFYNIIGNIVWFIPLGLLLPFIEVKFHLKEIFCISFALSFGIEIAQFILNCGISDIDDIIFNVIGGCIGYLLYKAIKSITNK